MAPTRMGRWDYGQGTERTATFAIYRSAQANTDHGAEAVGGVARQRHRPGHICRLIRADPRAISVMASRVKAVTCSRLPSPTRNHASEKQCLAQGATEPRERLRKSKGFVFMTGVCLAAGTGSPASSTHRKVSKDCSQRRVSSRSGRLSHSRA